MVFYKPQEAVVFVFVLFFLFTISGFFARYDRADRFFNHRTPQLQNLCNGKASQWLLSRCEMTNEYRKPRTAEEAGQRRRRKKRRAGRIEAFVMDRGRLAARLISRLHLALLPVTLSAGPIRDSGFCYLPSDRERGSLARCLRVFLFCLYSLVGASRTESRGDREEDWRRYRSRRKEIWADICRCEDFEP